MVGNAVVNLLVGPVVIDANNAILLLMMLVSHNAAVLPVVVANAGMGEVPILSMNLGGSPEVSNVLASGLNATVMTISDSMGEIGVTVSN